MSEGYKTFDQHAAARVERFLDQAAMRPGMDNEVIYTVYTSAGRFDLRVDDLRSLIHCAQKGQ